MKPNVLILFTLSILTSCSMFEHRDFVSEMDYQFDQPMFEANRDFMVVPGDTGRAGRTMNEIYDRTPATAEDAEQMRYQNSLNRELNYLENKLTDEEYSEYEKYKHKIGESSKKIYYLRLSPSERQSYLKARNINIKQEEISMNSSRSDLYRRNIASNSYGNRSFPKINDIVLGMSKDDVLQNWGQPERRDIAGNPDFENERWAYRKNGSIKYIYFEAGRVEGWTEH